MKKDDLKLGILFSFLNTLCLGTVGFIDKIGSSHAHSRISYSALTIVFSFLFASLYALGVHRQSLGKKLRDLSVRSYFSVFLIGISGSGIFILLRFLGLSQSTGTFATLSQVVTTCITALLAYVVLKERLSSSFYILFSVIVAAIYFVSVGRIELATMKQGDVFILAGTFFLATANIISKVAVKKIDPFLLTAARFFFASLFLVFITTFIFHQNIIRDITWWTALSGLLWAGNITFFNLAIQRIGVTFITSFLMLAPILTMVLEFTFLHRFFNPVQIVASLIVVASGILMVRLKK